MIVTKHCRLDPPGTSRSNLSLAAVNRVEPICYERAGSYPTVNRGAIHYWMKSFAVATSAILLTALSRPAAGWDYYKTNSGKIVHWEEPIVLYKVDFNDIDEIEADGEIVAIQAAFALWNELSDCIEMVFDGLTAKPEVRFHPPNENVPNENHVVFVASGWHIVADAQNQTSLAFTRLSYETATGRLMDFDIAVNLDAYEFSLCDKPGEPADDAFDFFYTMLHEAGHTFGLAHSDESSAVMDPHDASCTDAPPHQLAEDDKEGYAFLYSDETCVTATHTEDVITDQPSEMDDSHADLPPQGGQPETSALVPDNRNSAGCTGCPVSAPSSSVLPVTGLLLVLAVMPILKRGQPREG